MTSARRDLTYEIRSRAARIARDRVHPTHEANGDEERYAFASYAMSFTKGLEHDAGPTGGHATGLLKDASHFRAFREAINKGYIDLFTLTVPVPTAYSRRKWEAPTAGLVTDLQGPDAQAVTMPPAPALGSDELAYEMAEVYELALLRDKPLSVFVAGGADAELAASIGRLNGLAYRPADGLGRPRKTDTASNIDEQTAFRGSSPGVEVGPYLSQFMLIGNDNDRQNPAYEVDDGMISYGTLLIDQRVPVAHATDYMTTAADWLAVQNGYMRRNNATLFNSSEARRFISTPRDLATYVHDDALYEAYLNACLILLGMEAPFDPGFGSLSGDGAIPTPGGASPSLEHNAGGFALYGGPHILTLVTEVATRALKAVRFQKFNNHMRLRPEALGGRIACRSAIMGQFPAAGQAFDDLRSAILATATEVEARNGGPAFLPMAFQEGSPMHPSYGAGHAAVAGACVTILKAFFDTSAVFVQGGPSSKGVFKRFASGDTAIAYGSDFQPGSATNIGDQLILVPGVPMLTLEGELNKLAANISIGRNMAGVHYFSDYYDSLRMGEQVAIELLEEQATCYPTDPFVLSVPTFDGDVRRIGAR